ncbi:unnamed protein product [Vitrella brassicaformis CCMP3155]|uniref:A-kinase anchor protein 7-like phosphoesterase domain-containing protein n=2 Tax=Vitrella brassicaformis TaxID=1169539 RepID=A0A0G4GZJ5_VITBC|nr:unnamed protein product [Vitrella brassicaformis CCMP3155]|mmetsp:Transcript_28951/g.72153  ORF Transcript_28951/g.72153 Transcript_28951/m.72153 type:complete len:320 (+) Transcript_28951:74-1033(+)|eukprot:CEM36637.1 unnamed protein product [Vitrella brassicaformis CCMP3155]
MNKPSQTSQFIGSLLLLMCLPLGGAVLQRHSGVWRLITALSPSFITPRATPFGVGFVRRSVSSSSSSSESASEGEGGESIPSSFRLTHFVGVRVDSHEIQTHAESLQDYVVGEHPHLDGCRIPLQRLHISLLVCGLESQDLVERATDALQEVHALLQQGDNGLGLARPFELTVPGLGSFGRRVLYGCVDDAASERLAALHRLMGKVFVRRGIPFVGHQAFQRDSDCPAPFTPHLTILKTSQGVRRLRKLRSDERRPLRQQLEKLGIPSVDEDKWRQQAGLASAGAVLGCQSVHSIELLSMQGQAADGYYPRVHSLKLQQ